MKKIVPFLITFLFLSEGTFAEEINDYTKTMKQDILTIYMAYPEIVSDISKDGEKVYVVLKSGTKILYDDRKNKTQEQQEENGDIQDMLKDIYPLEAIDKIYTSDPGRVRCYKLLEEAYGKSSNEVLKNMKVNSAGIAFNEKNNAGKRLANAIKTANEASKTNSKIGGCIYPLNGTFNYRNIAGTGRLSPHAFGIALDFVRDNKDYWRWASPEKGNSRIKEYPKELPRIMEENYFIWGGKWKHFDILHYEYRPEIIIKAKYFSKNIGSCDNWYNSVDIENTNTKEFIDKIESIIGK